MKENQELLEALESLVEDLELMLDKKLWPSRVQASVQHAKFVIGKIRGTPDDEDISLKPTNQSPYNRRRK